MKLKNLWYRTRLHSLNAMQRLDRLVKFNKSETAQFRSQVVEFHKNNGTAKTIEAYGVPKPTIYRWRMALKKSEGKLNALIPKSTAPKNKREMIVDYRIIEWIKKERESHLVGKGILRPLLDSYCQTLGIKPPSESLIGKIINRKNIFPRSGGRMYHNANSRCAQRKISYKQKVKKSPKPEEFGYLEIDTITQFNLSMKRYVFNAIDVKLKFKFSYPYKNLNSRNAKDFFMKLEQVYPFSSGIKTVQTDNGLEFMGEFNEYLKQRNIPHLFIYPRCPKINGYIERANRTLKQEFLNKYKSLLFDDMDRFKHKLMEHLVWYNTKRIHQGLGNKTPMDYLLENMPESQMYVTSTYICFIVYIFL